MRTILILFLLAAPLQAAETIERLWSADRAVQVFIIRSVENPSATEVVVIQDGSAGVVKLGGGIGLPPVSPPDPPAEPTLTTFVRGLTVKVDATEADRQAVADIFTRGAADIRTGKLGSPAALVTWTNTQMDAHPEWAAWFKALMVHVLPLERLKQPVVKTWAGVWGEIGKGVAP